MRRLFTRHLELGSVHKLQREPEASGLRSKVHVTATGKTLGGAAINRGALCHLLINRIDLGEIGIGLKSGDGAHNRKPSWRLTRGDRRAQGADKRLQTAAQPADQTQIAGQMPSVSAAVRPLPGGGS